MHGLCEGQVAVISGAGRGLGRAHALALADAGAKVVANDLADRDGRNLADEVVEEIRRGGGTAISHGQDVSTEEGAQSLISAALSEYNQLNVIVNNAGILRDAAIFNMTAGAWDAVIAVHLRSTFLTTHYATAMWRDQSKRGEEVDGRIINTTSVAGLYGNFGQANYVAAKAGIAAFTVAVAREVERYGISVNALSPGAATRMTESLMDEATAAAHSPEHVAKAVVWLSSPAARGVTGRVIHVAGNEVTIPNGWSAGRVATSPDNATPAELGAILAELIAEARPAALIDGSIPAVTV
jgi:NAD(P)-dependent dehydrogenase (short-subunit alcohol dehydrogenase family)